MLFSKLYRQGGRHFFSRAGGVLFALILAIGGISYQLASSHGDWAMALNNKHNIHIEADSLRQSSDDLTRLARLYAFTENEAYKADYDQLLAIRNGEISRPHAYEQIYWHLSPNLRFERHPDKEAESLSFRLDNLPLLAPERDIVDASHRHSDELAIIEISVFAVVGSREKNAGELKQAVDSLFSDIYQNYKQRIMSPLDDLMQFLDARHSAIGKKVADRVSFFSFLLIPFLLLFLLLWGNMFAYVHNGIVLPMANATASFLSVLRWLNIGFVVIPVAFLVIIGASFFVHFSLSKNTQDRINNFIIVDGMRQSSDDLTRLARLYAMTGNQDYAINYQNVLDIRNGDIPRPVNYHHVYWELTPELRARRHPPGEFLSLKSQLQQASMTDEERALILKSQQESNNLANIEVSMFKVLGNSNSSEEDKIRARRELFSDRYIQFKSDIMLPLDDLLFVLKERYRKKQATLEEFSRFTLSALTVVIILFGILLFCMSRITSHLLPPQNKQ